jgi:hypothetical protein
MEGKWCKFIHTKVIQMNQMPDKPDSHPNFWKELRRRRVIGVIPVYAAAAFALLELVDIISDPLGLPEGTIRLVLILLLIGLIITIILSWLYDITPDGVKRQNPQVKLTRKQSMSNRINGSWLPI